MWVLLRILSVTVFVLTGLAIGFRDLSGGFVTNAPTDQRGAETVNEDTSDIRFDGMLEIARGANGHFRLEAEINGETVDFLVDTGASVVVFGPETAERLGFDPESLDYSDMAQTANGKTAIARIVLEEIVIGDLTLDLVEAAVVQSPMKTSLLGMSFLSRLEAYEVRDGRLVLHW